MARKTKAQKEAEAAAAQAAQGQGTFQFNPTPSAPATTPAPADNGPTQTERVRNLAAQLSGGAAGGPAFGFNEGAKTIVDQTQVTNGAPGFGGGGFSFNPAGAAPQQPQFNMQQPPQQPPAPVAAGAPVPPALVAELSARINGIAERLDAGQKANEAFQQQVGSAFNQLFQELEQIKARLNGGGAPAPAMQQAPPQQPPQQQAPPVGQFPPELAQYEAMILGNIVVGMPVHDFATALAQQLNASGMTSVTPEIAANWLNSKGKVRDAGNGTWVMQA